MTLGSLLTIIGLVLAIYSLASPSQRKSISLFVPLWIPYTALGFSGVLLIVLELLIQWDIKSPLSIFLLGTTAFTIPLAAILWSLQLWQKAILTKHSDAKFRDFIHSCIQDDAYSEAVRILDKNKQALAGVLKKQTFDLIFDSRFVRAMSNSQTWIHLELLSDFALLDSIPNYHSALDRTIRELAVAEDSVLRKTAIMKEGGDETVYLSENDKELMGKTFQNANWYHKCRAGYPLVIVAWERISSGIMDETYNQADALYGSRQGISTRSRCPVFIAMKTITHALEYAIEQNTCEERDIHEDSVSLWDIFKTICDRSVYQKETWDEPFGFGDYPTPYGYLLAEILYDYKRICDYGLRLCNYGNKRPISLLGPVIYMWAHSVFYMCKKYESTSQELRKNSVVNLLEMIVERRQFEINVVENREEAAAWTRLFVDNTVNAMSSIGDEMRIYLSNIVDKMDPGKPHILANREWLVGELGLNSK